MEIYSESPEQSLEFSIYDGPLSVPSRAIRVEDADRLISLTLPGATPTTRVQVTADSLERPARLVLVLSDA